MSKNIYDLEIIMLSTYCDISSNILKRHKSLSVIKLVTFSYLTKKNKFIDSDIYSTANSNDLVLKYLSQMSGLFEDFCENLKYIIGAIHLLVGNNIIVEKSGELIFIERDEIIDGEKDFLSMVIDESNSFSDRQFLKEVVSNV